MTLFEDIVELDILPGAASVTSTKPWAQRYDPVEQYRLNPSTQIAFDTIFGESTEGDGPRYDQAVVQAPEIKEYVRTEGDVARVFNKHIGGPVMEFWNGQWYITQSSESSPFRSSSFEGVVDTQFVKIDSGYHQLAIVEFKAPGTIAPSWSTGGAQSSGTKRLGRELRGYAYEYGCPQVGCYDGSHFLIISFPALKRADIKTCTPDVFVLEGVGPTPIGGIYLRYALDRLIENGVRRAMALRAAAVAIGTWERRFEWFNGSPFWYDTTTNTSSRTVTGIVRRYHKKENRWAWHSDKGEFYSWCAKVFF